MHVLCWSITREWMVCELMTISSMNAPHIFQVLKSQTFITKPGFFFLSYRGHTHKTVIGRLRQKGCMSLRNRNITELLSQGRRLHIQFPGMKEKRGGGSRQLAQQINALCQPHDLSSPWNPRRKPDPCLSMVERVQLFYHTQ